MAGLRFSMIDLMTLDVVYIVPGGLFIVSQEVV